MINALENLLYIRAGKIAIEDISDNIDFVEYEGQVLKNIY